MDKPSPRIHKESHSSPPEPLGKIDVFARAAPAVVLIEPTDGSGCGAGDGGVAPKYPARFANIANSDICGKSVLLAILRKLQQWLIGVAPGERQAHNGTSLRPHVISHMGGN